MKTFIWFMLIIMSVTSHAAQEPLYLCSVNVKDKDYSDNNFTYTVLVAQNAQITIDELETDATTSVTFFVKNGELKGSFKDRPRLKPYFLSSEKLKAKFGSLVLEGNITCALDSGEYFFTQMNNEESNPGFDHYFFNEDYVNKAEENYYFSYNNKPYFAHYDGQTYRWWQSVLTGKNMCYLGDKTKAAEAVANNTPDPMGASLPLEVSYDFEKDTIVFFYNLWETKCVRYGQGRPTYPGDDGQYCAETSTDLVKYVQKVSRCK